VRWWVPRDGALPGRPDLTGEPPLYYLRSDPHSLDARVTPTKRLGKASWTATAKDDVDIYDGPGGAFNVAGMLVGWPSA
jgi:hypothetical protein